MLSFEDAIRPCILAVTLAGSPSFGWPLADSRAHCSLASNTAFISVTNIQRFLVRQVPPLAKMRLTGRQKLKEKLRSLRFLCGSFSTVRSAHGTVAQMGTAERCVIDRASIIQFIPSGVSHSQQSDRLRDDTYGVRQDVVLAFS